MELTLVITIILLVITGLAKAVMQTVQFHYDKSIFDIDVPWWFNWANPEVSWQNKYRNNNPSLGPRFFLSTTLLVFVTDLMHLAQFVMNTSWQIALATHFSPSLLFGWDLPAWLILLLDVVLFKSIVNIWFHLPYSYFFNKKTIL